MNLKMMMQMIKLQQFEKELQKELEKALQIHQHWSLETKVVCLVTSPSAPELLRNSLVTCEKGQILSLPHGHRFQSLTKW